MNYLEDILKAETRSEPANADGAVTQSWPDHWVRLLCEDCNKQWTGWRTERPDCCPKCGIGWSESYTKKNAPYRRNTGSTKASTTETLIPTDRPYQQRLGRPRMPPDQRRVAMTVTIPYRLIQRAESWGIENRCTSRSEMVEALIQQGLDSLEAGE